MTFSHPEDLWINDIQHVGYNDIVAPSSSASLAVTSPCIGDDLQGVYFSPAVQHGWDTARRKSKFIDSFSAKTESPVLTGKIFEIKIVSFCKKYW